MADTSVNTGASGQPIRVLTALGAGSADQQVITLADSAGNLLGTSGAPFPVTMPGIPTALGPAAPSGSQPVNLSNDLTVTGGIQASPVINTDLLTGTVSGWYDAANFHSVAIQVITGSGITGGAVTFEETNDTTLAAAGNVKLVTDNTSGAGSPLTSLNPVVASTLKMFNAPVQARYIRVRVSTAVAGGNIQVVAVFSQLPYVTANMLATQPTPGNLNVTAQISNTPNTTAIIAIPVNPNVSTTGDTGAKTATFNGATQTNTNGKGVTIVFNIGAVTGTSPTLQAFVQVSSDGGTNWVTVPNANTASLTATGLYGIQIYPGITAVAGTTSTGGLATVNALLPKTWRVFYSIGGTTPSFTITSVSISYAI